MRAACGGRRAASCRGRRGSSPRRSARTSIGTPLRVTATSTSRWRGLRLRSISSRSAANSSRVLGPALGRGAAVGECRPGLLGDRDLAALPGPAADLDARLQQGELVGPGGEAAFAAEVVELAQHRHQRVVGALLGEVLVVVAAQVGQRGAAAVDLEAGRLEQQGVQLGHRGLPLGPSRAGAPARAASLVGGLGGGLCGDLDRHRHHRCCHALLATGGRAVPYPAVRGRGDRG